MTYYRTTSDSSTLNKGEIVTLPNEEYKLTRLVTTVTSGDGEQHEVLSRLLEEVEVKKSIRVIAPVSRLVSILEAQGYEVDDEGGWRSILTAPTYFNARMFCYCGKKPSEEYVWLPEWLEETLTVVSVKKKAKPDPKKFIIDFMKKKQELTHPAYLYQRDIDEIENTWGDKECELIMGYILSGTPDFSENDCSFCLKVFGVDGPSSSECAASCPYGKRHGVCYDDDSDFQRYIVPLIVRGTITEGLILKALREFIAEYTK